MCFKWFNRLLTDKLVLLRQWVDSVTNHQLVTNQTDEILKFVNTVRDEAVISPVLLKGFTKILWESKKQGTMVLYTHHLGFQFSGTILVGLLLHINHLDNVSYLLSRETEKLLNLKYCISQWNLLSVHFPQAFISKPPLFYISVPRGTWTLMGLNFKKKIHKTCMDHSFFCFNLYVPSTLLPGPSVSKLTFYINPSLKYYHQIEIAIWTRCYSLLREKDKNTYNTCFKYTTVQPLKSAHYLIYSFT